MVPGQLLSVLCCPRGDPSPFGAPTGAKLFRRVAGTFPHCVDHYRCKASPGNTTGPSTHGRARALRCSSPPLPGNTATSSLQNVLLTRGESSLLAMRGVFTLCVMTHCGARSASAVAK